MKKTILIYVFILVSFKIFGQTITGKTVTLNGKIVPFVNIGIPLKNIGTVSADNGKFILQINKSEEFNDTVYFSILGFKTLCITVKQLLKNSLNIINLEPITYQLDTVTVKPKNCYFKTFGNTFNDKDRLAGYRINELGNEIGILMRNKKTGIISSVGFNIAKCTYDTLFLRLNIYKFRKKQIAENILKKPYYIKISKNKIAETGGNIKINLDQLNIKVNGKFLVAIETIMTYSEPDGFYFCDGIFSTSTAYSRETSFGKWDKGIFNPSIRATVRYEK